MATGVLQIDSESTWRGGENQLRLLLEGAQGPEWDFHLAAPPGSQAALRLAKVAKVRPTPMRGLKQLSAAWQLARYCRTHKIQLIDCQSSRAHQLGLMIKMLVPTLKLVVHRRVDYAPGQSPLNRKKYTDSRIDSYIAISEAIGTILKNYGIEAERIEIVRSAVDGRIFREQDRPAARASLIAELGFDPALPVIGNVAYITEQKGHATLIRALGQLKAEGVRFSAFIAGDGELRAASEALAASLGLGPQDLRFLGIRDDVPRLMAASDIFALSSNDEGLGTSLLDATHAGCCLVATRVGGIPEIVRQETTGLLAEAGDAEGFARQLKRALQNPDERVAWVKAAQAWVDEAFSLRSMVEGNLRVYRRLLFMES